MNAPSRQPQRLLVIDDEASLTRLLKLVLERRGPYEVRVAQTGAAGIALAREFQPHLVIVDVILPDLNGGAVCAAIQSDRAERDVPFIFLTALVTPAAVAGAWRHMARYPFLPKPFQMDALLECIRTALASPVRSAA